jgi:hypothetical protein
MRYHAMLCRGARLVGYREEECWDDPDPGVAGFKSRANLSEPGHASHLRALGGKKMQLDIVTAVLVTGAGMLLQMSEARARKEALIKPAGGPSLDDNRLRQEEWQRRLEETRERLGKGMGAREGEREFASRVQEAGYTTEPVGTDRIETRTQKRRGSGGAGGKRRREEETEKETEEEEGTHRADTTRSEVWKKSSRWKGRRSEGEDVGGSGIRKDVAAALGGFTEEEYKRQVEELERLREEKEVERSREGGKRRRDDREEEPSMEEEEEANRLRKLLEEGEEELRRRRDIEGDMDEASNEEEEETEEEPLGDSSQQERWAEEAWRRRVVDEYAPNARQYSTEWGLARLKGRDCGVCVGASARSWGSAACLKPLNKGVKAGAPGNVVLMK